MINPAVDCIYSNSCIVPSTSVRIVSPRIYCLRSLQAANKTINLSELTLEQCGLSPVTSMHHVSKVFEGIKINAYMYLLCYYSIYIYREIRVISCENMQKMFRIAITLRVRIIL